MSQVEGTRQTVVEGVEITHFRPGDPLFPYGLFKDEEPREQWMVTLTLREGMMPRHNVLRIFDSESEANDFVAENSVGSILPERQPQWVIEKLRHYLEERMDEEGAEVFGIGTAGDFSSSLAIDTLRDAGICNFEKLSPKVETYLGKSRIGVLKNKHRDNWRAAAAFEYCWLNLPHSSPAYVAAAYQYHFYITNDDFSAGYLWRDLEVLVCGVEAAAQSLSDMRKKASDAGGKRSAKARELRRADLMDELERVAERNPEISALGPELVSRVALKNCISRNLSIWRQGKGQIEEYLGELRRGEAGPEMQSRFLALFPAKPPKR